MATRFFLRSMLGLLSVPFVWASRVAEVLDIGDIRRDVRACLQVIDSTDGAIPAIFLRALVIAEDRRSALHVGVDPIAIVRAVAVRVRSGGIQGASTIEQQFVRVVSGRYERSLRRKFREQLLAIAVTRRRTKSQIREAYLSIAFYGSGAVGLAGLEKCCGRPLDAASTRVVFGAIARLKYPEPNAGSARWLASWRQRVGYIEAGHEQAAGSAMRQALAKVALSGRG